MSTSSHHETASEDRISLLQKSAYSLGMLVNNLQAAALPAMAIILNLGLGINPVLVGIIGFAPRIFDAISDPMMGYISDNTRSRWGRRRPYIFVGALLAGVVFAAMWQLPPGQTERFYFWTFLTASIFYFLIYTMYATPLVAFGYEMTPDYHERTRLHAFANTVGQLAWLGVPWFYAIMANKNLFENEAHGARVLAVWVGGAICLLGVIPAIFCRERGVTTTIANEEQTNSESPSSFGQHTADFFRGFKATLQCKPFVKLCAATFLVFNGFQLGVSFTLYVLIYYIFGGDKELAGTLNGWFGMLTAACTLCVIPLTGWIATRLGKRETFLITISLSLIGYALKWVGYNPNYPYLLIASCPFIAFGTGSLFTLMGSMISDVCDYDELQSHERREGLFGAIFWWMVKVGMALAGLMAGVLLNASGFDVHLGTAQPEEALYWLRIFDVGIPIFTSAVALWVMSSYEITEARAIEIREELEQRRGKLG